MDGAAIKLLADDDDPLIQAALGEIKRIFKELSRRAAQRLCHVWRPASGFACLLDTSLR